MYGFTIQIKMHILAKSVISSLLKGVSIYKTFINFLQQTEMFNSELNTS